MYQASPTRTSSPNQSRTGDKGTQKLPILCWTTWPFSRLKPSDLLEKNHPPLHVFVKFLSKMLSSFNGSYISNHKSYTFGNIILLSTSSCDKEDLTTLNTPYWWPHTYPIKVANQGEKHYRQFAQECQTNTSKALTSSFLLSNAPYPVQPYEINLIKFTRHATLIVYGFVFVFGLWLHQLCFNHNMYTSNLLKKPLCSLRFTPFIAFLDAYLENTQSKELGLQGMFQMAIFSENNALTD